MQPEHGILLNLQNTIYICRDYCFILFAQGFEVADGEAEGGREWEKSPHKKLFGGPTLDGGHPASMADILHKVESLFQERDSMVND